MREDWPELFDAAAKWGGDREWMERLIARGADINHVTPAGETLMHALLRSTCDRTEGESAREIAEWLIRIGWRPPRARWRDAGSGRRVRVVVDDELSWELGRRHGKGWLPPITQDAGDVSALGLLYPAPPEHLPLIRTGLDMEVLPPSQGSEWVRLARLAVHRRDADLLVRLALDGPEEYQHAEGDPDLRTVALEEDWDDAAELLETDPDAGISLEEAQSRMGAGSPPKLRKRGRRRFPPPPAPAKEEPPEPAPQRESWGEYDVDLTGGSVAYKFYDGSGQMFCTIRLESCMGETDAEVLSRPPGQSWFTQERFVEPDHVFLFPNAVEVASGERAPRGAVQFREAIRLGLFRPRDGHAGPA